MAKQITTKEQIMIYKTLYTKLQIERMKPTKTNNDLQNTIHKATENRTPQKLGVWKGKTLKVSGGLATNNTVCFLC